MTNQALLDTLNRVLPSEYTHLAESLAEALLAINAGDSTAKHRLADASLRAAVRALVGQTLPTVGGDHITIGDVDSSKAIAAGAGAIAIADVVIHIDQAARPRPKRPQMALPPPEDFVARPIELEQIVALLLGASVDEHVAITAALRGAGGYGKTVLARAVCHDSRIDAAFPGGVLWVTLGEAPGDLAAKFVELIEVLTTERPGFSTVEAAASRFSATLGDRRYLLVIDDVWEHAHLAPFVDASRQCIRLITTRNSSTLPAQTHEVQVDAMRSPEALALLGAGLTNAGIERTGLHALAARLGEWPLLLKLVSGILRAQQDAGEALSTSLAWVNAGLDEEGLTVFDSTSVTDRHMAVRSTLEVSLRHLSVEERERFAELAIFPEDVNLPLATLQRLWGATGGLSHFKTRDLCRRLFAQSLVVAYDASTGSLRLHDVVRSYLRAAYRHLVPGWNTVLLAAHQTTSRHWADLPDTEPYLWTYLAYHLLEASQTTELVTLVKDLRYLARKTTLCGPLAVEEDLLAAGSYAPDDMILPILTRSFVNASHLVSPSVDYMTCATTLYSRFFHVKPLQPLIEHFSAHIPLPALMPLSPLPDLPHPALMRTLISHTARVSGCAISADGRTIVSASSDHTVRVWDGTNGHLRATLTGHTGGATSCAISADGSMIVSASYDYTLRVWDGASGHLRTILDGHTGKVNGCAISADGHTIVSASDDKTLRVWDSTSRHLRTTLTGHTGQVTSCAISADGHTIVSASDDKTLRVWDSTSGHLRATLIGHTGRVTSCAISANGHTIVSASSDQTVRVWDGVNSGLHATLIGHTGEVHGCAISADGRTIISVAYDKTIRVWDGVNSGLCATLTGHTGEVHGCAISANGHTIVSASSDQTVRLWDGAHDTPLASFIGHTGWVWDCAVSADGHTIVSASYDDTVRVWDGADGRLKATLAGHTGWVTSCAISADGRTIVSASSDDTVWLWDNTNGRLKATLAGHTGWVTSCAISANGRMIVSASHDRTVRVWDGADGRLKATLAGHTGWVTSCAISADGRTIVSASSDQTVRVWDGANGRLRTILTGHVGMVHDCAVSADGRTIVSASSDQTVRVWDGANGRLRTILTGHVGMVHGCAVSADGHTIVSASPDQTVRVWDGANGLLTMLHLDGPLDSCACSADNSVIVAGGRGGGIYFLRLLR